MKFSIVWRPFAVAAACALGLAISTISATAEQPAGWYGAIDLGGNSKSDLVDVRLTDGGGDVARATTDDKGHVVFSNLAPGHYTLVIDGRSLAASLPGPKKESHSSFGIGVGGMFGGGHSSSGHPGAGPAKGGSHSSSGGGVGLGMNIPVGGGDDSGKPVAHPALLIALLLPAVQAINVEAPVPTDASHDLYIGFNVQTGGTVRVQLSSDTEGADGDTPTKREATRTWISGVGDDANPCSRTAPCVVTASGGTPNKNDTETGGYHTTVYCTSGSALVGVPVVLENESGRPVDRATTGAKCGVEFRDLKAGHYTLTIDGKRLAAAIDKAGPEKRESNPNIIFGSGGGNGHETAPPEFITISLQPASSGLNELKLEGTTNMSGALTVDIPYCPDAKGNVRVHFTVPEGAQGMAYWVILARDD